MMLYVKDTDETAIRKSASHSLRRFVEAASLQDTEQGKDEFLSMIKGTIISGIEKGLRDQPEEAQTEYLAVLSHIIKLHPQWATVNDMIPLLGTDDDEASFFVNILHIQKQHRRPPAMRRLAEEAKLGTISSNNIYHIFIPLIERFIFNPRDEFLSAEEVRTADMLSAEAIRTIGVLVEWIDWQQCRVLLKRFISYVKSKADMQETILKLLDATTIAICHSSGLKSQVSAFPEVAENGVDDPVPVLTRLAKTMPAKEKMTQYLVQDVISPLTGFLHDKDESFVSRRISVAVIVARFLQLLPQDEFEIRLPALLTDTCNILRSKDQGSRDMTRKALTTICKLIGPSSVGYVLRELRSALRSGFYLHVLSFTAHSILETTAPSFKPGDLDYCASEVMSIILEDIFGNTGKEKEAAEYLKDKNTKKEVKGKKSFDSIQLLASVTSLTHLIDLVRPIENLLFGRLNHKDARNIDELLRRIELGLLQNESVRDRDVLVFCYEIIKDTQNMTPAKPKPVSKYLHNKTQSGPNNSLRTSDAVGRLTRFALELVRSVLRKHKSLQTPANISGFMPIIGDALLSNLDDVKLASIRLFTAILNIPLTRIDSDAPIYIAEAARVIEDSPSTNDELSQAALKLISAVLRERRSAPVKVKEKTLAILLKKMKPDLQVISQQGVAFNLLRSIIARKIVIPELYEIIDGDDGVAAISVRDHDRTTRDLARGVYFQFLMDYPQGKDRFAKQLTFLIRNLEYEHAEGRQSVMETLHLLLTKVGDTLVQQIVQEACWPLVSAMVNDDSSDCREMASGLVKAIFERADDDWVKNFLALFRRMLEQGTKDVHKRTALQCWTIYLEVKGAEAKDVVYVQEQLSKALDQNADDFDTEEWQLVYYALHTLLIISKLRPDTAFGTKSQTLWEKVQKHLAFPQSWVKQEAAKLIGMYIADFASSSTGSLSQLPLSGSNGLKLDGPGMCILAARNLRLLREGVSEELAAQAVRNLAFLGRCFASNEIEWQRPKDGANAAEANIESDDDGGSAADDESPPGSKQTVTATDHLFHVLSGITRRELRKPEDPTQATYRRADVLYPKTAALQLTAALCTTLSAETLTPSIDTILLPLIHLTDTNITAPTSQDPSFTDAYNALVTNATELMDLLQGKLGTTAYVQVLQRVKKRMQVKRDERRVKRKIMAVAAPERAELAKRRKREGDKIKRKEKGEIARGKRRGW
jgi:U3 small nucleolar RNA-associated protein 20